MKTWLTNIAVVLVTLITIGGAAWWFLVRKAPTPHLAQANTKTAYDFQLTRIDGQPMPLNAFRGQVILLVNTASKCGYTPQYHGLQKLHDSYHGQGLTIIGVPSGDFMGQELANNTDISSFCQTKFGIKFAMAEKAIVTGPSAIPLYQWAAARFVSDNTPKWNFHKFLIGRDGQPITAFSSGIEPTAAELTAAVEKALQAT
jgi:glutathione peroxidase